MEDLHLFGVFIFCYSFVPIISDHFIQGFMEEIQLQAFYDLELADAYILFLSRSLCS